MHSGWKWGCQGGEMWLSSLAESSRNLSSRCEGPSSGCNTLVLDETYLQSLWRCVEYSEDSSRIVLAGKRPVPDGGGRCCRRCLCCVVVLVARGLRAVCCWSWCLVCV